MFRPTWRSSPACRNSPPQSAALDPIPNPRWARWRSEARAEYEAGLSPSLLPGQPLPALDLGQIMVWLRERLPDDAIVTSRRRQFQRLAEPFSAIPPPRTAARADQGAMGYGVPAAVAAKLVHPDRIVVGFCGDGGFMMTGQELATAQSEGVGPIILLFNNAMYGTIRMHQERRFPGRVVGTALKNPDFAALADAYGASARPSPAPRNSSPAFEMALRSRRGAVIELRMDPEMITTRTTLAALRRQAETARA